AGLLLYRRSGDGLEVLIVHPGGPFFAKKDAGVWSLPKGEYTDDEDALVAARREFAEETGHEAPAGEPLDLGEVRQSNKIVRAFAYEGDLDAEEIVSNHCDIEWPGGSGRIISIPEIDRAEWVSPAAAALKLVRAQVELVDRLCGVVGRYR
ncbi:MAG TPA: NUDIX domain-containing protein, partial [Acidimicrobiales bacterium]|nr:NUDIX domain-containing protein [Acidimicrobiales bacterium]